MSWARRWARGFLGLLTYLVEVSDLQMGREVDEDRMLADLAHIAGGKVVYVQHGRFAGLAQYRQG